MVKYYYAGSTRVAMRTGTGSGTTGLLWLFGDHLCQRTADLRGSTSRVANADGTPYTNGEQRYKPFGEKRYPTGASGLPTTFRYTGQRQETGLGPSGGEGLYYYGARFYDPYITQFSQPDTVIPDYYNPLDWNRYSYARYNPLKFVDPTGHAACADEDCKVVEHPISGRLIFRKGYLYKNERGNLLPDINDKVHLENRGKMGCGGRGCDLGGNKKEKKDDFNIYGMAATGVVLSLGIAITELCLFRAEVAVAPLAVANPPVGVPIEIFLIGLSLTLIDVDVAYASYVYRSYQAGEKQEFKWFYPWGLPVITP